MKQQVSAGSIMGRSAVKKRVALLVVLLVVTASVAYPAPADKVLATVGDWVGLKIPSIEKPFVLGLDLQGGTRLEYSADLSRVDESEQRSAMDGVRDVIERRVNTIGVSEPLVQIGQAGKDWRVTVELAGIQDISDAITLIGETPILEFKEQNTEPQRQLTDEERGQIVEANTAADAKADEMLKKALDDPGSFEQLVAETTEDTTTKGSNGDLGFIKTNPDYLEIYDATKQKDAGTVYPNVITTPRWNIIARVEEVKDAGTEIFAHHILIRYAGATNSTSTRTKEDARALIEDIKAGATSENFIDTAMTTSEEPGANETGGALGWFSIGDMVKAFEDAAFALPVDGISDVVETQFGYHLIYKSGERSVNDVRVRAIFIKKTMESDIVPPQEDWKNTELTGKNLKRAYLDFDPNMGAAQVALTFDDEGTKMFADITRRNVGQPVAIFLDNQPISVPTVESEITGGQAVISGNFTIVEAKLLAQRLNAGALPVPINLIAQQSVGPTLGRDSVNASLIASLWGFALVALFMLLLYRLPGLLAILNLGLYVVVSLAIFKLVPVTLTLAGIAGFILSIGIAVDANVLVFERFKEEIKLGKSLRNALEEAFKRAWTSIRDGNMTTLISCAVLYWFSSSIIKGFALTLAIGILLSMFSAVVATRTVLRYVSGFGWAQRNPWLFPGTRKPMPTGTDSSDRPTTV
ncbi:protein translocase subunit SecD [Patescibacteria group bacterium]|nr:protein translocase subunit SecD [Patescibacteria group bacterium]MBU1448988.1 protein translocase subunit SecD [Patescibacteria group bacterium]MBU2613462.1 protein translocase subunit SecD [Patescibacteria group bacterium]